MLVFLHLRRKRSPKFAIINSKKFIFHIVILSFVFFLEFLTIMAQSIESVYPLNICLPSIIQSDYASNFFYYFLPFIANIIISVIFLKINRTYCMNS